MALHELAVNVAWNGTPQGIAAVRFERFDGERCEFAYSVRDHEGNELAAGADLRLGAGKGPDHVEALAALLDFLSAAGEEYRYAARDGRPLDRDEALLPEAAAQWAAAIGDELAMAREELQPEREEVTS